MQLVSLVFLTLKTFTALGYLVSDLHALQSELHDLRRAHPTDSEYQQALGEFKAARREYMQKRVDVRNAPFYFRI